MTHQEYAQKFKGAPLANSEELVLPDAGTDPTITVVNSSESELYKSEMDVLAKGGADYEGREEITAFMREMGR
jgi:hypothetical protein